MELLYFGKWNFLAISLKKSKNDFSYIPGGNLQNLKPKNILNLEKWNFLAPRLNDLLYFIFKKVSALNFF